MYGILGWLYNRRVNLILVKSERKSKQAHEKVLAKRRRRELKTRVYLRFRLVGPYYGVFKVHFTQKNSLNDKKKCNLF